MSQFWANAGALVPSIGVLALFALAVRAIIQADRREREQRRREDAALAADRAGGAESGETRS